MIVYLSGSPTPARTCPSPSPATAADILPSPSTVWPMSNTAMGPSPVSLESDLIRESRPQIIDNCEFLVSKDDIILVITAKDPSDISFKAYAVRCSEDGREVLLESAPCENVQSAVASLQTRSCEAVHNYITANGFAKPRDPKAALLDVLDGLEDNDNETASVISGQSDSSTATFSEWNDSGDEARPRNTAEGGSENRRAANRVSSEESPTATAANAATAGNGGSSGPCERPAPSLAGCRLAQWQVTAAETENHLAGLVLPVPSSSHVTYGVYGQGMPPPPPPQRPGGQQPPHPGRLGPTGPPLPPPSGMRGMLQRAPPMPPPPPFTGMNFPQHGPRPHPHPHPHAYPGPHPQPPQGMGPGQLHQQHPPHSKFPSMVYFGGPLAMPGPGGEAPFKPVHPTGDGSNNNGTVNGKTNTSASSSNNNNNNNSSSSSSSSSSSNRANNEGANANIHRNDSQSSGNGKGNDNSMPPLHPQPSYTSYVHQPPPSYQYQVPYRIHTVRLTVNWLRHGKHRILAQCYPTQQSLKHAAITDVQTNPGTYRGSYHKSNPSGAKSSNRDGVNNLDKNNNTSNSDGSRNKNRNGKNRNGISGTSGTHAPQGLTARLCQAIVDGEAYDMSGLSGQDLGRLFNHMMSDGDNLPCFEVTVDSVEHEEDLETSEAENAVDDMGEGEDASSDIGEEPEPEPRHGHGNRGNGMSGLRAHYEY
ncbi:hypothetical protein F5Y17DRAFT_100990 [Xylariaceae sp. FL0594]|nr:hypothetical protein F5Y17DRAFT_100990 [Xylariaceae sp. FL0594]